ncbi:MAG: T9SS type A sorting domain-containing protein [Bacteroidia bacterium]
MKNTTLPFLFLLLFSSHAWSQTLLEENFDYPTGALLNANGWFSHSAGATNPIAVGQGLSLAGTNYLGNGLGGSALVSNTGSDENRPFSSWVDSGSFYTSFLLNLGYVPTSATSGYFFHLGQYVNPTQPVNTSLSSLYRARTYVAPGDSGKYKLGLTFSSSTIPTTGLSQNLDTGVTYLVVLKYTFIAGTSNDLISAYVFESGADLSSEPSTPTLGPFTADNTETSNLQCVVLRQFNAAQRIMVDGIRVSLTWDLSPVSCQTPTNLTITSVDTTFATMGWDASPGATSWLVEYAALGSQPGSGTILSASTPTATITGLTGSTAYTAWVRSVCSSGGVSDTSAYSMPINFTTPGAQIPSVSTLSAQATGFNTAVLNGEVTADGGLAVSARGFAWSRQPNPNISGAVIASGSGLGTFSSNLTNIPLNTTFFVRAYATNLIGTAYGSELSFTTPSISRASGATTALVEDFDYPDGSLLRNNNWSVHSGGTTNPITVTGTGLSFPQSAYYGSNIGGAAQVVNTGADENRNFTNWIDSGAVYASFMLRGNAVNSNSRGYFLHLAEYDSAANPVFSNVSSNFRGRTYITQGSTAATFRLGLTFNSATVPSTAGVDVTSDLDTGATYLVVLKYQFVAGDSNDLVSLYVFGDGDNIYSEPVTPTIGPLGQTPNTTTFLATPDANVIQGIALRQYNSAQRVTVDGIRVRNYWDLTSQIPGGTLTGQVRYDNSAQSPMTNCTVELRNAQGVSIQTATTNNLGQYSFSSVPSGNYTLAVSSNKPWGGVNSTDALNVARHFSSVALLPGIRSNAADVNLSNSINSTDALRISQRTVSQISSFTAGDWYFQSPTAAVTSGINQQPNILALCYGDVNGSFNPALLRSTPNVSFDQEMGDWSGLNKGEIALFSEGSMDLGAVTLHMSYPSSWGRVSFSSELLQNNLLWHDRGGIISVSWYQLGGIKIPARSILGILKFENAEAVTDLSQLEMIENSELANEEAQVIQNARIIRAASPNHSEISASVFPNPSIGNSELRINLSSEATIGYSIYNVIGKRLLTHPSMFFTKGTHNVQLDDLPAGQYLIQLECSNGVGQQIIPIRFIRLN